MIDEGASDDVAPEQVVERFVAPDHRNHDPTAPPVPAGPQGVRQLAQQYREAFPDLHYEIEEIFASGNRVAHRWTLTGTQEGEIMGISPTGRRVEVSGLEINRVERGRIAESWAISDAAGLHEQLQGQ